MPALPHAACLAFLVASIGGTALSAADTLESVDGEFAEVHHKVTASREGRSVALKVVRKLRNAGSEYGEAELEIELPKGGVVSELRVLHGGRWTSAQLQSETKAIRAYDDFVASEGGRGAAAILRSDGDGMQVLRIFPIAPKASVTVAYTVQAPGCYRHGMRVLFYPETGEGMAKPRMQVRKGRKASQASEALTVKRAVAACSELEEGADPATAVVWEEELQGALSLETGERTLSTGRTLRQSSLRVAALLAPIPKRPQVVFVFDASRSQSEDSLRRQMKLADGYLTHVPDAEVQFVLARRQAQALLPAFRSAKAARLALHLMRTQLPERLNGSNLDLGVQLASTLLDARKGAAKRIIAFTDGKLPLALGTPRLVETSARVKAAVLHVVDTAAGAELGEFERLSDGALALMAEHAGGMYGGAGAGTAQENSDAMRELVAPTRIENVRFDGGWVWRDSDPPEVLRAGDGRRNFALVETAGEGLSLSGDIWGRRHTWKATRALDAEQTEALAIGSVATSKMTDAEELEAATRAGVVSQQTAMVLRTGHAPRIANHNIGMSRGSFSVVSSSSCMGVGFIGGSKGRGVPERHSREILEGLLEPVASVCRTQHPQTSEKLSLIVETTGHEIVAVTTETRDPFAQCVTEGAWHLLLDEAFAHTGTLTLEL